MFRKAPRIRIFGSENERSRLAVFAVNLSSMDNGTAAFELSERWGIETRPGLHCSPLGHRTLGTFPSGALRISIGFFNTEQEIEVAIEALCTLAAENAPL